MDIEAIDLGDQPPAIGRAKTFPSSADEAILEAPLMWGSKARVRVAARIQVAGFVLYIPVEVTNVQVGCPLPCQPVIDLAGCVPWLAAACSLRLS